MYTGQVLTTEHSEALSISYRSLTICFRAYFYPYLCGQRVQHLLICWFVNIICVLPQNCCLTQLSQHLNKLQLPNLIICGSLQDKQVSMTYIDLRVLMRFILLLFMVLTHAPPFWTSTLYSKYWKKR